MQQKSNMTATNQNDGDLVIIKDQIPKDIFLAIKFLGKEMYII